MLFEFSKFISVNICIDMIFNEFLKSTQIENTYITITLTIGMVEINSIISYK